MGSHIPKAKSVHCPKPEILTLSNGFWGDLPSPYLILPPFSYRSNWTVTAEETQAPTAVPEWLGLAVVPPGFASQQHYPGLPTALGSKKTHKQTPLQLLLKTEVKPVFSLHLWHSLKAKQKKTQPTKRKPSILTPAPKPPHSNSVGY